jgi:hypothetical protein
MALFCPGAPRERLARTNKIDARSDVLYRLGELTALVARMVVKVSSRPRPSVCILAMQLRRTYMSSVSLVLGGEGRLVGRPFMAPNGICGGYNDELN